MKLRKSFAWRRVKIKCLECDWEYYNFTRTSSFDRSAANANYHQEKTGHRIAFEKTIRGIYENS